VRKIVLVLVVVLALDGASLLCRQALGGTIRAVGVLGNSGVAGEGLLRVGGEPLEHCASGAALDGDWTLWLSGGDSINRVGLDGHLIESFPLAPAAAMVDSRTFAVLDGTLYFLARDAKGQVALCHVAMKRNAAVGRVPGSLPERKRQHVGYCLSPQPLGKRLVLALEPKESAEDAIGVSLLDPATGECRQAFALKGSSPAGVAVDVQREVIYIGGNFGLFVGGETHSSVCAITAVRPNGEKVSDAFPAACPKTPATPTQFRGVISLAGGALWDAAWYGFLARLDMEGRGAPGRIVEWHHELDYPTQVLGILDGEAGTRTLDPLVIATPVPDAFHFAVWDRTGQTLRFVRRIGCLPTIASLGLSEDGWVTVGTARSQLWWRWEDPADAPARKAELHIAVTPLVFRGGQALALAAQYRLASYRGRTPVPALFHPRVGERNEARRVEGALPFQRPVGLCARVEPGRPNGTLFATDAKTRQLWSTELWLSSLHPNKDKWQALRIEGEAPKAPTDIAALADGTLLVADEGRIVALERRGDAYRVAWQLDHWGAGHAERFGKSLRLAVDGASMLVSDTDRHRVLWFDWPQRRLVGQLGATDAAGGGPARLRGPTLVALRGTRAVVADAGNQRVVKAELSP